MLTNCYNFLARFFGMTKRPATRPAIPSASINKLEGSGTGVPPVEWVLDEELADEELVDVVPSCEELSWLDAPHLNEVQPEYPQPSLELISWDDAALLDTPSSLDNLAATAGDAARTRAAAQVKMADFEKFIIYFR